MQHFESNTFIFTKKKKKFDTFNIFKTIWSPSKTTFSPFYLNPN